jgi:pimeloyl-ACP methyl ester carboxylesterase
VRRWWRLAVVPAALAAALLTVYVLAVPLAATVVPPTPGDGRTPADVGLPYREVRLPAAEGAVLAAWYVPTDNGAAVVLLHGAGSTRSAVLDHAAVLARNGFGVLLPDARGHGDSTGRAMDFGWDGDRDVRAATAYLALPESGVESGRIGAVGLSMGAEEALGAVGADDRLRAVVAEGATARVAADLDWLSDRYGWRGQAQEVLEAAQTRVTALLADPPPPPAMRASLAGADVPVLLIASGERPDEQYAADDLLHSAHGTVETWTAPRGGHTEGLRGQPRAWEERVVGFLNAELGAPGE